MEESTNPEPSELEKADVKLGKEVASHRHHPLVKAIGKAGKIADQEPLYAIAAAVSSTVSSRETGGSPAQARRCLPRWVRLMGRRA